MSFCEANVEFNFTFFFNEGHNVGHDRREYLHSKDECNNNKKKKTKKQNKTKQNKTKQ